MTERTADKARVLEASRRVVAARNNLLAASAGTLPAEVAGHLVTGAVLLLDAAAEWLEEVE